MGPPRSFDDATARTVLAALHQTGAQARACARGARMLAKEAGGFAAVDGARAARGANGTAEWCRSTQLELRRRLLALGVAPDDPVLGPAPVLDGFSDPAAARRTGAADGRALARALAGGGPVRARLTALGTRTADPEYAAALVEQLPPAAIGRAAAASAVEAGSSDALGGLFAVVALAEAAGTLSSGYRRRLLALPPVALGPLLSLGTFSAGFVVAAVTGLFAAGPAGDPAVARARILGLRAAAAQPPAARALLARPATTYRMLHLAAGWPGLDPAVRADADRAAARVLTAGLAPTPSAAAEVTAAWRTVLTTVERHPGLLGLSAGPHRPVHRALAAAFVPYLPYAAWQAAASGAADSPVDGAARPGRSTAEQAIGVVRPLEPVPVLVPCYPLAATARFLGLVIADRDAFGVLRAGALRHAAGDRGPARYIAVDPDAGGTVILSTGLVGQGALLTGLFSLFGRAAAAANTAFTDRVAVQGAALELILGVPLGRLDWLPGADEVLDASFVARLVGWFVRRRTAAGPRTGPAVLGALGTECARRIADRIDYSALAPADRAAARILVQDTVLARVVQPLLLLTDPGGAR